jgi:hypothetical protein
MKTISAKRKLQKHLRQRRDRAIKKCQTEIAFYSTPACEATCLQSVITQLYVTAALQYWRKRLAVLVLYR